MISYALIGFSLVLGIGLGFRFGGGIFSNSVAQECIAFCPDGTTKSMICAKGSGPWNACTDVVNTLCGDFGPRS